MGEPLSKFATVESAIRILRKGKHDPRWQAAAQFLIDRAAPDVQLLLEAAQELERRKLATVPASPWRKYMLAAASVALVVVITVVVVANLDLNTC